MQYKMFHIISYMTGTWHHVILSSTRYTRDIIRNCQIIIMINEIVLEYTCLNKTWFKEIEMPSHSWPDCLVQTSAESLVRFLPAADETRIFLKRPPTSEYTVLFLMKDFSLQFWSIIFLLDRWKKLWPFTFSSDRLLLEHSIFSYFDRPFSPNLNLLNYDEIFF